MIGKPQPQQQLETQKYMGREQANRCAGWQTSRETERFKFRLGLGEIERHGSKKTELTIKIPSKAGHPN
jgi:hypothetical protein